MSQTWSKPGSLRRSRPGVEELERRELPALLSAHAGLFAPSSATAVITQAPLLVPAAAPAVITAKGPAGARLPIGSLTNPLVYMDMYGFAYRHMKGFRVVADGAATEIRLDEALRGPVQQQIKALAEQTVIQRLAERGLSAYDVLATPSDDTELQITRLNKDDLEIKFLTRGNRVAFTIDRPWEERLAEAAAGAVSSFFVPWPIALAISLSSVTPDYKFSATFDTELSIVLRQPGQLRPPGAGTPNLEILSATASVSPAAVRAENASAWVGETLLRAYDALGGQNLLEVPAFTQDVRGLVEGQIGLLRAGLDQAYRAGFRSLSTRVDAQSGFVEMTLARPSVTPTAPPAPVPTATPAPTPPKDSGSPVPSALGQGEEGGNQSVNAAARKRRRAARQARGRRPGHKHVVIPQPRRPRSGAKLQAGEIFA